MSKPKGEITPITRFHFIDGDRYRDCVAWAFDGCWRLLKFDLSQLTVAEQTPVFLAALNAEKRGQEYCEQAAANALLYFAAEFRIVPKEVKLSPRFRRMNDKEIQKLLDLIK